jgi:exosortase
MSFVDSHDPRTASRPLVSWTLVLVVAMWAWAIWSCAEHWRGNPNYSYGWAVPLLALGFGIRRYFLIASDPAEQWGPIFQHRGLARLCAALALGALGFLLEYSRQEMWHPQIVLWSICLLATVSTLAVLYFQYGPEMARAETFPVFFFLTAAPWPPRIEQPITSSLIHWVATVTVEILHWLGIEAQAAGGAIALPTGLVGITEACSGIRSLQAGIMFGLAMGEWFLLRPVRRLILLLVAIALALATNLIRTLALTLEVQRHGLDSLDRYHDIIGNIMITLLILAIWLVGRFLAPSQSSMSVADAIHRSRARGQRSQVDFVVPPIFRPVTLMFLAGLFCARILYAGLEARDRTQTTPFFVARMDDSTQNKMATVPRAVWNELNPTSGEYIRHENPELPGGGADCFHFFWKPSPWNRFALVHRPDICMPGIGWTLDGPAESREVQVGGHAIRCYLFRFRRQNMHALELWGAWRNGKPVAIEYRPEEVLGVVPAPSSLDLAGKRRSATEIVACNIMSNEVEPDPEIAVAVFQSVFDYKPDE